MEPLPDSEQTKTIDFDMPVLLDTSKPPPKQSLIGKRFGRLIVISFAGWRHFRCGVWRKFWNCLCDCGKTIIVEHYKLVGARKSCGCLGMEANKKANTKHGLCTKQNTHAIYYVWCGIHGRCYCKTNPAYKNYGARGIEVCARWHTAANFIADMMPTWKPGLEIERRDNDGPYSPENCYWATRDEQANNKRTSRFITYNGETKTVAQWAKWLGCRNNVLWARLFVYNWSVERALTAPIQRPIT